MNKFPLLVIIACLLFYGCSKEKQKPNSSIHSVKISLVSGNNQTIEIGNPLTDSIVVKVTDNGNAVSNTIVKFTGSGCNEDLIAEVITKSDGTAKYSWRMAGNAGSQTLKVVAFNENIKVDSLNVSASASIPAFETSDNTISACTPYNSQPIMFCKFTTGKLFACFEKKAAMRYSDDNGISWYPVKKFGSNHRITGITTTPQDEIFAATDGDGIFYSKDAGNTWKDITPATFSKTNFPADISYSNGAIIFTGTGKVFSSANKGDAWTTSASGLPLNYGYLFPRRLNNGDLYVVAFSYGLYKSTDGGITWAVQENLSTAPVMSICEDKNGWFYKSVLNHTVNGDTCTIYISKDNGQTFNILYSDVKAFITNMDVLDDFHLYFLNTSQFNIITGSGPSIFNLQQLADMCYSSITSNAFLLNNSRLFYSRNGLIGYRKAVF
jgi:photosystem II stability/assembly factor-like uncharacterized protein